MCTCVVILGAAFGGLKLSAELADEGDVTLGSERFVHLDNQAGAGVRGDL